MWEIDCPCCGEKINIVLEENQPAPTDREIEANISCAAKRIADLAWESVNGRE